jgi:acetylornithine deacetylase/succinyl-diaminopimelate desuccinylase-like protein
VPLPEIASRIRGDRVRSVPALIAVALLPVLAPAPIQGQQLSRERILQLTENHADLAFQTYRELLSLPNDALVPEDMLRVTEWLETAFRTRGFETERLEMPGSDALLATREAPAANRTVLIYLQADGQPVDPGRWFQDSPWVPVLKERTADGEWNIIPWERLYEEPDEDWRMFARSASDSKGPIAQFLTALAILDEAGAAQDFTLKVIVDTEEEMGSPHLPEAIARYRDKLAADMLVILDGPPHVSGEPTLTFGARGIATITLTTYGPRVAQHSGHWGNYVPNPALRLSQILASMKDEVGRVTIPGFYDGIALDDETRRILAAVPDDVEALHERMGISEPDAVAGSPQEAIQYPSINVRGMSSGWVGAQSRTIIPPTATAEIDVRLVLESDPERLIGLIREHIEGLGYHITTGEPTDDERRAHPRIASFTYNVSYRAYRTDFTSEPGRWLSAAFVHLFGEEPVMVRTSGGSIPISLFVTTLGVPAVSVGTVNPDNNQHSPNENLRVGDFLRGIRIMTAVLSQPLAEIS